MNVGKWNYEKKDYDPYKPEWELTLMSQDMGEIVHCASCGIKKEFGETYTSREIHTISTGFGFPVCEECYNKEIKRDKSLTQ
jgi:hypothetical protein